MLQRHRKSEEKYRALENKSHNNSVKRSMPIMFRLGNTLNTFLCKLTRSKLHRSVNVSTETAQAIKQKNSVETNSV